MVSSSRFHDETVLRHGATKQNSPAPSFLNGLEIEIGDEHPPEFVAGGVVGAAVGASVAAGGVVGAAVATAVGTGVGAAVGA
jgi:hypothetical protein